MYVVWHSTSSYTLLEASEVIREGSGELQTTLGSCTLDSFDIEEGTAARQALTDLARVCRPQELPALGTLDEAVRLAKG